jgi:hypothetical protein
MALFAEAPFFLDALSLLFHAAICARLARALR